MFNIKRQFKVLSLRFKKWMYITINSEVDKEYINIQKKVEIIITKAIDNEESIIYQYSNVLYIIYNDFVIKFDERDSLITNGKFSYYVTLPSSITKRLIKQYKNRRYNRVLEIDKNNDVNMNKNLRAMIKELS